MNIVTWIMRALLMSSVVIVTACGGGSGGSSENVAPMAFDLAIESASGGGQSKFSIGDQLEASYEYYDADNDPQGNSQIRWYRDGTVIAGANSAIYFVQDDDAGKQINFSVTPIALTGQSQGRTVHSSPQSVEEATTQPDPTPVSVSISGAQSVAIGASATLSATVQYSAGSPDSNVTWSTNNASVLTVSTTGQITGVSVGTAVISASAGDVVGTYTVEVFESFAIATGISISGSASSTLNENQSSPLEAMVAFSDGSSRSVSVNWSSNNTSVATVSSTGMVAAVSAGNATITAEFDGFTATHQVTVQASEATVQSVSVSGVAEVEEGQNAQYTATLHYSDGSSVQGAVQWASSSTAIASINSSGLLTANSPGQVTLTATLSGVPSASITVTITEVDGEVTLESVSINGSAGVMVDESISLSATAAYSDGSSESVAASWSSSNASVASLSAASGSSVDVTGAGTGTATITASFGGMSDTHVVTVTEPSSLVSIEIFPKTLRTNTTDLQQAIAVGTDGEGHKMGLTHLVNWSSSDSSVVSIGATGELTIENASGSATITASYAGIDATYNVTELEVGPPPGFYIYFRKPDSWQNANFYVYLTDDVADNQPTGEWGGIAMDPRPDLGDAWYSVEVQDEYISSDGRVNFLFNDFGGSGAQSDDLFRSVDDGSQWWTNESTASDTPPEGMEISGIPTVGLNAIGEVEIYTDGDPGTNLVDADVAAGTVMNIVAGDAPLDYIFDAWSGSASLYVVDPNADPGRMVAVDVGSMTLQPTYRLTEEDPYEIGRDEYVKQCENCHGVDGVGGDFGDVTREALEGTYPTIEALATYISEEMPFTAPSECSGTSEGDCAYEIAAMIFGDGWEAPEGGSSCNVNSFEDMVPSDRNLRVLTKSDYLNSVEDIFGITVDSSVLDVVPPDSFAANFDTASFLMPDSNRISGYDIAAGTIAEQVINDRGFYNLVSSCNTNTSCVVENLGLKVFRRPLSNEEVTRYAALYSAEDSGESVIHAMLISPYFLMRSELGVWDNSLGYYRLTNYEVATLLSYTFWGTTPDATLLQAAGSTNFDIQAQAERLLNDPRAVEAFDRFTEGWLFDRSYPFSVIESAQLQADLREETLRFVSENVFNNQPYDELITANYSYMNSNVANFYGERNVSGWERVEYTGDNATRSGVLGHASFLATHTSTGRTSPIKRGVYLRHALLCQEFPPPVAPVVENDIPDNISIEDLFRLHTEDEGCQSCHQFIDEPGFSFQNFGMDGLLRATELAVDGETVHSVDGTGAINSLDSPETVMQAGENIPYNDMRELGELLADSPNTSACYVRQFYRYTNGRKEKRADECTINVMGQKFRNGQQNLRDLMIEMTTMPNYTVRK